MITGATFSEDRFYRYHLWRHWNPQKPTLVYVLLNPSTADELRDDPTIKRCIVRGFQLDFGGIEILNLFAMRSTYPHSLSTAPDPVGPANDAMIALKCRAAGMVICGWGKTGNLYNRAQGVLALIRDVGAVPHALKLNTDGTPQHPLYLKYSLTPFPLA
jgi:hypothetical protein